MKIRKAVLPVAGLGTRFMPATKVVPKELLPIANKPVIQYLVEEALNSGIDEIIFVISKDKELIRDHFSHHPELEETLQKRGKQEALDRVKHIHKMAKYSYVYQNEPLGDGDAVLRAREAVGDEPFVILFGDDIVKSDVPAAKQLIDQFTGESIIAVQPVPEDQVSLYGIVEPGKLNGSLYKIHSMIEKPTPEKAPSNLGIIGKYVCSPAIFEAIVNAEKGRDGELRLIDGFIKLMEKESVWAYSIIGKRFDTGKAEGLIAANNAFL